MTGPRFPGSVRLQDPANPAASRLASSRDLFSMDRIPFPRALRQRIADAELRVERGELSFAEYEALITPLVEAEMVKHTCENPVGSPDEKPVRVPLSYVDGWNWYPSPPARHNPDGVSMCWWRFRGNG